MSSNRKVEKFIPPELRFKYDVVSDGIKLSWIERIRVLFTGRIYIYTEVNTQWKWGASAHQTTIYIKKILLFARRATQPRTQNADLSQIPEGGSI